MIETQVRPAIAGRSALTQFVLLCALSIAAGWHALASTLWLGWNSEEYTHILLILPVSSALIWLDWPSVRSLAKPNMRLGAALLTVAVFVFASSVVSPLGSQFDVRVSIEMLALVIWSIGSFVFCFGSAVSKRLLFPLCFMFWMVPFPQFLLKAIVALLQQWSAVAADLMFTAVGVPVAHDGVRLLIPGLTLEVAKECSSIRSSMMLVVTTMVLAQLTLRSSWRKGLAFLLAVPLSVAKNGLRIFTIAILGTRVDRNYLTGRFHHHGGGVFFAIALILMMLLIWLLKRTEVSITVVPRAATS